MTSRRVPLSSRDVLIAASLANLCYLRLWAELFCIGKPDAYYLKVERIDFLAAGVNVLLLAAAFLAAAAVVRLVAPARSRLVLGLGIAGVLAMQANWFGPLAEPGLLGIVGEWSAGRTWPAFVAGGALAVIIALVWWQPARALAFAVLAIQVTSPFVLVTFGRAAMYATTATFPDEGAAPPIGTELPSQEGPRLVVFLFDAMGRAATIDRRPDDLEMPELDRLRKEAIDASAATQAGPSTRRAVPALLSGVLPKAISPTGSGDLSLVLPEGNASWSELPNLFRHARAQGGNATVVGWAHPYCRVFADDLSACSWYSSYVGGAFDRDRSFGDSLSAQMTTLVPYADRGFSHLAAYRRILADAKRAVAQPGAGITWVHLPVPHEPYLYNRESGEITVLNPWRPAYYDNLAFADRTLGELRRTMEEAGTWDSSTVIVLSDHASRRTRHLTGVQDRQIPWVVKLAGQKEGVVHERPFHAVLTYELARGILTGEITEPAQVTAWLDANAERSGEAVVASAGPAPKVDAALHRSRVRGAFWQAGAAALMGTALLVTPAWVCRRRKRA